MKKILLASASVVAFAGAAAADVSYNGEVRFGVNDGMVFDSASLNVTGSVALDNGLTATAKGSVDYNSYSSGGSTLDLDSVSIAGDNVSLTYDIAGDAAGVADFGDALEKETADVLDADETATFIGSATFGSTTLKISSSDDGSNIEVGLAASLGGADVMVGYDADTSAYAAQVATSAAGADITLGLSSEGYGIQVEYPVGDLGLTLNYGDAGWQIGVDYAMGDVSLGATYDDAGDYSLSVGYVAGALDVAVDYDNTDGLDVVVGYDMGNGLTMEVGSLNDQATFYAGADYDLGGGATLYVSQTNGGAGDYATFGGDDIMDGTTIGVVFSF